jgi:hypothetical protein
MPDALYRTAFQLFDTSGSGTVGYGKLSETFWGNVGNCLTNVGNFFAAPLYLCMKTYFNQSHLGNNW